MDVKTLRAGDHLIDLSAKPIMGILNITPDSFFDGGKYGEKEEALARCEQMLLEGATIIDIGANSSRPGSVPVSVRRELDLLLPTIELIYQHFPDVILSVDTFQHEVAREVIALGVPIINDISAGDDDPKMFELIATNKSTYIAMHKQGTTQSMQKNPIYKNVLEEVHTYFQQKIDQFRELGIEEFVLDPGFGFGKSTEHNYQLLTALQSFKDVFHIPLLVGLSRKSMVNKVLNIRAEQALNGTTVLHTYSLLNGADILRVHDVREAVEVVKLVTQIQMARGEIKDAGS